MIWLWLGAVIAQVCVGVMTVAIWTRQKVLNMRLDENESDLSRYISEGSETRCKLNKLEREQHERAETQPLPRARALKPKRKR